jgi:DNA-binding IclR family transcriptional regulator
MAMKKIDIRRKRPIPPGRFQPARIEPARAPRDEILTRNPSSWDDDGGLFVASLAKGLKVLYAFGGNESRLNAVKIAKLSGLDPSSAQRFIYTLTTLGALEKDERTKQYRLSARLLDFAYLYLRSDPLCAIAQPHLHNLSLATAEQVNLSILDRADVIYVARFPGAQERGTQSFIGGRMPSFWTSNGRTLLADLSKEQARAIVEAADRRPLTPHSKTDPTRILAEIDLARRQGFAVVDEESETGVLSIAAPVIEPGGRAVAAINLPLAKTKWSREAALDELLPEVLRAAQTIGRSLIGIEF